MTPQNVQPRWTPKEEAELRERFRSGWSLREMSEHHGRTPNAIITRLVVLGELVQMGKAYYEVSRQPAWTFEQIKHEQQEYLRNS